MPKLWATRQEVGGQVYIDFIHVLVAPDNEDQESSGSHARNGDLYIIWDKMAEVVTVSVAFNENIYGAFTGVHVTYNMHPFGRFMYGGLTVGEFVEAVIKELQIMPSLSRYSDEKICKETHKKVVQFLEDPEFIRTEDFLADIRLEETVKYLENKLDNPV